MLATTIGLPLRAWNRLSIFIAFFALLAVGRALTWAAAGRSSGLRVGVLALTALVTLVGVLDQTSPAFDAPPRPAADQWASDTEFVGRIEATIGPGGSVLQLPYLPFPEHGPLALMSDYDPVRGYLHSRTLHWSYGAMRNRPEDIAVGLQALTPEALVPVAVTLGFEGLWLDRNGLGGPASALELGLSRRLGGEPMVSQDNRFAFFDLTPARAGIEGATSAAGRRDLAERARHPVSFDYGAGFFRPEADFERHWVWMGPESLVALHDPLGRPRRVLVTAEVETAGNGPATLFVDDRPVALAGGGETVTFPMDLRAPDTTVRLRTDVPFQPSGDSRDLRVRLIDLRITDEVVATAGGRAS